MTVTINGIRYARLFPVPPPPRRNAAGTEFGGAVRLDRSFLKSDERRYLKSDSVNPGDTIDLTLRWQLTRPVAEDLTAVVELVDRRGATVARHAAPLGGGRTSTMHPSETAIESHRLELPDAANEYSLVVGLQRSTGEWLPITSWPERLAPEARRAPGQVIVDTVDAE